MKQLLILSALFGWPLAAFSAYRMSTLVRDTLPAMRWGYALILAGSLLQGSSSWVMDHGTGGMLAAARALIVGLLLLSLGLLLLVMAFNRRPYP